LKEVITIRNGLTSIRAPERSHVELSDPDEAVDFLESAYGVRLRLSRRVTARPAGGVFLTHRRTDVGPFTIDEVRVPGELTAAPDPLNKVVAVWATSGTIVSHCDGVEGKATAGEIALTSQPDLPHHTIAQDLTVTSVLLEPALVAGVAAGVPSSQAAEIPVRFSSFLPVDAAACRLWKETVSYVKDSVLADDAMATPLVRGHASRLLAAVTLAAFPHVVSDATVDGRVYHHPVLLRRAMEYMDSNATNDIALADVADAIHVTPRALQYLFRRHLDTTPLQYLRRLRLHYAHQDLLAGDPAHDTVTAIAARWGFAHTGRFALLYRQTYGQSPHRTLRS
jgi:AraC-like DNA-binding protein